MYSNLLLQGREAPGIYISDLAKQDKILAVTFDTTIKQNHRLRSNSDIRLSLPVKSHEFLGHGTKRNSVIPTSLLLAKLYPYPPYPRLYLKY